MATETIESDFVGIKEAAKRLGVSERLVYALTEKGEIPFERVGTKKQIPRAWLDEKRDQWRRKQSA